MSDDLADLIDYLIANAVMLLCSLTLVYLIWSAQ